MELRNRFDIKEFIILLEQKFDVNSWKVNEIHLWPLIRLRMYMDLVFIIEDPASKNKVSKKTGAKYSAYTILNRIKNRIRKYRETIIYKKWLKKLKKRKTLFISSQVRRFNYNGILHDKFFDPIIIKNKLHDFSFLDYDDSHEQKTSFIENNIKFNKYDRYFTSYNFVNHHKSPTKIELGESYDDFLQFVQSLNLLSNSVSSSLSRENMLRITIPNFANNLKKFSLILSRIKPKELYMLCYYQEIGMAIVSVANKMGIKTIEMQHGPQTEMHLAFAGWSNIPEKGYDMLPRNYWCWDQFSKDLILSNLGKNPLYDAFVGGNTWLEFEFENENNFTEKDYFLYSLQPSPVMIESLFHPNLIDVVKNSTKKWFIRFHPRQSQEEIDRIKQIIVHESLFDKIDIELPNSTPLPTLIKNCFCNITHFSGTTIESYLMNKKTILLDKKGEESFPELIEIGSAFYTDVKSPDFKKKINQTIGFISGTN